MRHFSNHRDIVIIGSQNNGQSLYAPSEYLPSELMAPSWNTAASSLNTSTLLLALSCLLKATFVTLTLSWKPELLKTLSCFQRLTCPPRDSWMDSRFQSSTFHDKTCFFPPWSPCLAFPHQCLLLCVLQTLLYHTCPLQLHLTAPAISQLPAQLFLIHSFAPQYFQRQYPTCTGLIVYVR